MPINDGESFMNVNFVNINDVKLTSVDTILVLHPNPQAEIIKKFEISGARVLTLNQIVVWMHSYIFRGVRALVNYSIKHPDVRIVCYRAPWFPAKDWSAGEREIKEKGITYGKIMETLKNGVLITHVFDGLHYTNEELLELLLVGERTHNLDGEFVFTDKESRLVNYVNGHRVTTDQPSQRKRSIFALGRCYMTGSFATDDKTICSYLQRRFNEDVAEFGIVVENYAVFPAGGHIDSVLKNLSYIPAKPNDIILTDIWAPQYFSSIDLSGLFQRPHNYGELFVDIYSHFNERGYRAIAGALFNFLQENDFFEKSLPPPPRRSFLTYRYAAAYVRHTPRPHSRNHSRRPPADLLRQRISRLQSLPQANQRNRGWQNRCGRYELQPIHPWPPLAHRIRRSTGEASLPLRR
jgi:hypothetical protein